MPDIQDNPQSPILTDSTKITLPRSISAQPPSTSSTPTLPPVKPIEFKMPPFFWSKTQELIKQIEQKTNSKVLVYYMELSSKISDDDVDYFYSHVRDLQSDTSITLILVSSGGSGMAAWRIANVLKKYCVNLTVVVPSRCASAATLLSLSADKILFGPAGYLTAIDTTLNHPLNPRYSEKSVAPGVSVDQINKIKNLINEDLKTHYSTKSMSEILFEKIHPVVIGELERTSNLSKMIAKNLISLRNNQPTDEEKNKLIDTLNDSYPAHAYPIVLKEAQQIGLPAEAISEELNGLIWDLTKTYSLVSKRVITHINSDFNHIESIPVLIESNSKRTFFGLSFDNKFKPGFGWGTENDKSRWISAFPNPEDPEKVKFSDIEL